MKKIFRNIFIKDNKDKELSPSQIEQKLDKISQSFFKGSGAWYSTCFNRPNELNKDNLLCHLRDYNWLARMIQKENNLYNIDIKTIEEYLKNSQLFNEQRDKYEKRIIFWQINWIKKGGEGWIVNHTYGGDFFSMGDKCDSIFRQGIIDTLTAIGMDREVIEESIEYYSDL